VAGIETEGAAAVPSGGEGALVNAVGEAPADFDFAPNGHQEAVLLLVVEQPVRLLSSDKTMIARADEGRIRSSL
jgi:hypothetical protein